MYRSAIERTTVARPSSQSDVTSYDRVMKAVHWLTLLLVIGAFACIWAARQADSKSETEFIIHLHQSLGLTILGVTIFRLCWRRRNEVGERARGQGDVTSYVSTGWIRLHFQGLNRPRGGASTKCKNVLVVNPRRRC